MNALLAVLTPIALISSTSMLPSGIAGVVASLGTRKPYLTAGAFIAGRFVPQFAFGLLLVIGLDAAFDRVNVWPKHGYPTIGPQPFGLRGRGRHGPLDVVAVALRRQ